MARRLAIAASAVVLAALLALPIAAPPLASLIDPAKGVLAAGLQGDLPSAKFRVDGVAGEAWVYFDSNGIPHVEATGDEAGFYAAGWLHASLRLFQMDLFRRIPQGELSALVGEAGLESDRLVLTLGFREAIRESVDILYGDPRFEGIVRALEAYVRGVNDYIEYAASEDLLPLEYRLLGLEPEPWDVEDVIALQKFFQLMLAWDVSDLVLGELVRRHGLQIALDLGAVSRPLNIDAAECYAAVRWGDVTGLSPGPPEPLGALGLAGVEAAGATLTPRPFKPSEMPGAEGLLGFVASAAESWGRGVEAPAASNNWVVAPRLTLGLGALLANDPHLALTAPSLWLPIHLRTPSFNVAGVSLPGIPLVVIGRNESVAWGFTNVGSDFADFYYYEWEGDRYVYKGELLEPERRVYEVRVWDPVSRSYRVETVEVLATVHGPVLEWEGGRYAVAFTGSLPSLEVVFLWLLNQAESVEEALAAQQFFTGPPQNMVVADRDGNIAYSPVGAYPVRANIPVYREGGVEVVNTGFLPFNGSLGEGEWVGFKPLESLPVVVNPPEGYIATANTRPFPLECWLDNGWDYADRFRLQRILDLLSQSTSRGPVTVVDMMRIQLDTRDLGLELIARIIVELAEGEDLEAGAAKLLEILRSSEPSTSPSSPWASAALLAGWSFRDAIWEALNGPEGYEGFLKVEHMEALYLAYTAGGEVTERVMSYLGGLSLEDLAAEALRRAWETGLSYFGTPDPERWAYGKLHYYNIRNPIVEALSLPKAPAPGGPFSVNVAPPATVDTSRGAPVEAGPSVRLVSDMASTVIHLSLPGGSSGNPLSKYYGNLYQERWLTGRYAVIDLRDVHPPSNANILIAGG